MYQILVSLLISDQTIEINNLYSLINYTFEAQDWCLQIQSIHIIFVAFFSFFPGSLTVVHRVDN